MQMRNVAEMPEVDSVVLADHNIVNRVRLGCHNRQEVSLFYAAIERRRQRKYPVKHCLRAEGEDAFCAQQSAKQQRRVTAHRRSQRQNATEPALLNSDPKRICYRGDVRTQARYTAVVPPPQRRIANE